MLRGEHRVGELLPSLMRLVLELSLPAVHSDGVDAQPQGMKAQLVRVLARRQLQLRPSAKRPRKRVARNESDVQTDEKIAFSGLRL